MYFGTKGVPFSSGEAKWYVLSFQLDREWVLPFDDFIQRNPILKKRRTRDILDDAGFLDELMRGIYILLELRGRERAIRHELNEATATPL